MRYARVKFELGQDGFMHVYNRTVGTTGEFPFGRREKEEFFRRLEALNEFYAVEVLSALVMGNHFHAILYVPADLPPDEEVVARYRRRYPKGRKLRAGSRRCRRLAMKLRDVSEFMAELQQPFTRWFNRTRPRRRRGHLWAGRFKNTLLEGGLAVWDCWKYIEMNPVRAHLATHPAEYRFGSYGRWSGTGTNPFAEALKVRVLPSLQGLLHVETLEDVRVELRKEFARMKATDERRTEEETCSAIAVAAEKESFTTRADRRVRYWVDGLIIGSESYIHRMMQQSRRRIVKERRRFTQATTTDGASLPLYCWKRLRVLTE